MLPSQTLSVEEEYVHISAILSMHYGNETNLVGLRGVYPTHYEKPQTIDDSRLVMIVLMLVDFNVNKLGGLWRISDSHTIKN